MKRALAILLILVSTLSFCSCSDYVPKEQPVPYTQDIDVVITKIEKKQWFAGTAQREVEITVYSKEYNLIGKDTEHYVGMFGKMPFWEYEKGDTVKARMIIFIMESTGEITNRYIDKVY